MLFHATNTWLYATLYNLVSSTQNPCSSNPCRNGSTCVANEGTTAGQPLAIYRRLGRTGDEWRVGHVVLKKTLISSRMDGLILLYLLS